MQSRKLFFFLLLYKPNELLNVGGHNTYKTSLCTTLARPDTKELLRHTQRQPPVSAPHGCVACPGEGPWGARTLSLANLTRCLAHLALQ